MKTALVKRTKTVKLSDLTWDDVDAFCHEAEAVAAWSVNQGDLRVEFADGSFFKTNSPATAIAAIKQKYDDLRAKRRGKKPNVSALQGEWHSLCSMNQKIQSWSENDGVFSFFDAEYVDFSTADVTLALAILKRRLANLEG